MCPKDWSVLCCFAGEICLIHIQDGGPPVALVFGLADTECPVNSCGDSTPEESSYVKAVFIDAAICWCHFSQSID